MSDHTAYVGLGANLGDSKTTVTEALRSLGAINATRVVAKSSLYSTKPWQASGPDYTNAVAKLVTQLEPEALLRALQKIEAEYGRVRTYKNAPRTLDLDLLLFDKLVYSSKTLTLPHARMHERVFVLEPLVEIEPDIEIPGIGSAHATLEKLPTI